MRNYILYPASKGSFSALCFLTFCLFGLSRYSYSQATVSNAFTYGNNTTPHIPLHLCESSLNLTINWQNATSNDSLVLYFPNSFEVDGLSNISILDSLSEIVGISFPVNSASGTLNLQFAYTGCLNQFSAINSALNTDDFAFQSYLLSNPSASSYTYNGNNMPLLGGNPATVSFSATTPTFEIASLLNGANFNGNANQIYQRRFSVSINSSAIDSFVLNMNQEADLQHLSLHIIDNNPSNGNFLPVLIHNDSCATSFSVPITLNSLIDYYAQPNNETRVYFLSRV